MSRAFPKASFEKVAPPRQRVEPGAPVANGDSDDEGGSDAEAPEDPVGEQAGAELVQYLLGMVWRGRMSAKCACVIAYFAEKGGCAGVGCIALGPKASSGHFQRKLDTYTGTKLSEHTYFLVDMPSHDRHECSRSVRQVPLRLPHECIEEECVTHGDLVGLLVQAKRDGRLPRSYEHHKIVRENPSDAVIPQALFVDGVKFTRRSNLLAIYQYNVLTGRRFLNCCVRKSELCHCGCRGWCSLWVLLETLRWSLECAGKKLWPLIRGDGKEWIDNHDDARRAMGGEALSVRSCLLWIKTDWGEFPSTFGLAGHSTKVAPCAFCLAHTEELHQHREVDMEWLPWGKVTADIYDRSCSKCEQRVTMTRQDHELLKGLLMYDRRNHGSLGRGLTASYPRLALRVGDRLEPCAELRNVDCFEQLDSFPCTITWWRRGNEGRVRHRCPLLCSSIGSSVERVQIDVLHCIYLGAGGEWVARSVWSMLLADVFNIGNERTEAERIELGVQRFRSRLWGWYATQRPTADADFTPLEDLTASMFGSKGAETFKSKGAECKTILPFVISLLEEFRDNIGGDVGELIAAGRALVKLADVIKTSPDRPDEATCEAFRLKNIWTKSC